MSLPAHWVNGSSGAAISTLDRGFRYGDSLFETLRVCGGEYHLLSYHLQRLERGCRVLDIPWTEGRIRESLAQGRQYLHASGVEDACARLTVSRGEGGQGYGGSSGQPTVSLNLTTPGLAWGEALPPARLIRCETVLAEQPCLAGIKHGNRLEQVLGAREVQGAGADEGFMLNQRGEIICAVSANVFALFGDTLMTPVLDACGVEGTVRRLIIEELAPTLGISVSQQAISWADLQQADEVFLTNALIGIRSVAECPGLRFTTHGCSDRLRSKFFARPDQDCA
jgi:4-amino-4-deoxychorismate lyase